MEMIAVKSSNVHSIGYENGTLYVRFLTGALYEYYDVPGAEYDAFLNAPSKGRFVYYRLRGRYRYRRAV